MAPRSTWHPRPSDEDYFDFLTAVAWEDVVLMTDEIADLVSVGKVLSIAGASITSTMQVPRAPPLENLGLDRKRAPPNTFSVRFRTGPKRGGTSDLNNAMRGSRRR